MKRAALGALAALALTAATPRAQVDVRSIGRAAEIASWRPSSVPRVLSDRATLSVLIELPAGEDPVASGLQELAPGWSSARAPLGDLVELAHAHPGWHVTWAPPRRPLLDQAGHLTGAIEVRRATGRSGRGVFVGVVDTGIDPFHADFRNADGTTRIAYLVDFSRSPAGKYPEAEAQCPVKCAVIPRTDIDAALASGQRDALPGDTEGHGTHVASLAAGNGGPEGKYVGIAPEADLLVVKAGDAQTFTDDAIAAATKLVFWLAEQEGRKRGLERSPAVVNLSLGGTFGPHDGTAPLERALGALVGVDQPGRAIVVAAGNSGGVYSVPSGYPNPRGVHTEVHVPPRSRVRVPIVTDPAPSSGPTLTASIVVWIAFRAGDDLRVGLDRHDGTWISPRPGGTAESFPPSPGDLTATILNRTTADLGRGFQDANAAVVAIEGKWPRDETYAITLEGHGTASLWVESYGDLDPFSGGLGALFPGATKEATFAIPAGHPDLIAVGATLNRTSWVDRAGDSIVVPRFGSLRDPEADSLVFFSGAGPTTDGRLKPDLVAPGALIAGAMGYGTDPLMNPSSLFADATLCPTSGNCNVVDDSHAIAAGTSMAAPLVAGAVALMLEANPSLTTDRILARLMAGAHEPTGTVALDAQLGAGALDLKGVLAVEQLEVTPVTRTPSSRTTWLTLGTSYARPDPEFAVPALLHLRDAGGDVANIVAASDVELAVQRGRLAAPPAMMGPGLLSFSVAASPGTGGDTLEVAAFHQGELVAWKAVPIAVDVNVAREGFLSQGGCGFSGAHGSSPGPEGVLGLGALIAVQGRRCRNAARRARSRGRRGTTDRDPRGWCRR